MTRSETSIPETSIPKTHADWRALAALLVEQGLETRAYVDDAFVAAIDRIMRVTRRLRSGQVFVNNWADMDQTVPFGGVKQSGNGRDKSHHSLEEYSDLKAVWMSLTPAP